MSSVVNVNRWDQSRFEKFVEESSSAFEKFMLKGLAYPSIKAYVHISNDKKSWINKTDVTGGNYKNSLNVINYYNPSFRSVLPNMDGAIHSHSQTYGLFFISFITGFHNIQIYKSFGQCSKVSVQVDYMLGGGGNSLLTLQSSSIFMDAYIIGFSKDSDIANLAVRYSEHRFSRYKLSKDKSGEGYTSTEINYKKMTAKNIK